MSADPPVTRRHYALDPLPKALKSLPPKDRGRGLAFAYVLAGLLGSAASISLFLSFVTDALHFECESAPGIAVGYVCPAGLPFFPFGATVLGAYAGVVIVASLLLASPVRRSRLRRIRAQLLAVIALLPNAIFAYAIGFVQPSEREWSDYLLLPMVLLGTAVLAILFAAVVPMRPVLWSCVLLAIALCIVAAAIQPGLIPNVSVTFGILVAVLILDYRRSLIK
ncbi:MAG: hypothetical protein ABI400_10690 [Lacisediminihabitans sp.]